MLAAYFLGQRDSLSLATPPHTAFFGNADFDEILSARHEAVQKSPLHFLARRRTDREHNTAPHIRLIHIPADYT